MAALLDNESDEPLPRERICIALDVGAEMGAPWDVRRPDRGTRAQVTCAALTNWIARKAELSPRAEWALVVLHGTAEVVHVPTPDAA
eukprot:CAMPEP_0119286044 /NCGR_PEP_ID=MMETSP1329-20130426/33235_1 /TAXON_ID=114041 /ORGANISM="Genus nov. species nov., Strain RCC1024" /LENGTH=86 /DNA_ID=CAMNT_0007286769 /DNA_START=84 /DNA_END=340 /DNA_ORIENTATION=+